jgi:para-aminobenzoate synthetase/4-amino-4-deoxychorismate lyase
MPEHFELLESLLWRDGYPLLDLHLDRLEDSAHYFGFACDRDETRAALLDFARSLAGPEPRKVRLLLDRDGGMKIESLLISPVTIAPHARPLRVRISPERTDSRDPMLFHKTTYRPLYAPAWNAAIEAGYGDVLFLNQRGEVTESARSNIFIEKDGRLLTPPVDCGLLAGVERRRILEADPNAEERILTLDDLHQADAVYLSNAIRGLRRAAVDYIEVTPVPKTGDTYSFG